MTHYTSVGFAISRADSTGFLGKLDTTKLPVNWVGGNHFESCSPLLSNDFSSPHYSQSS
jgi:hypothetical protein